MTTAAEMTDKEKTKARDEAMAKREVELNAGKTGKGTRTFLGMTRGRNPQEIQYENWNESLPDSLPKTLNEFYDYYKVSEMDSVAGEAFIVRRLILGDNEILYKEASDPIAEFVEKTWPEDVQKQFKLVVRNYANAVTKGDIEKAVKLIKPGFVEAQSTSAKE